ncbi:Uma2 family endonuclease [Pimelobacter simplex]|uniref:Uma2 family endonuclease n=1 Tax=Nocardioides simplex TaxID=2045 RepID=UPI003AAF7BAD
MAHRTEPDVTVALLSDHLAPWLAADLARFRAEDGWAVEILDGTLVVATDPATGLPWTPADLARFPEGNLFEVVEGRLFVNAQPNLEHQLVADHLRAILTDQVGADLVALREIGIRLDRSLVGPDISVVRRAEVDWKAAEQPASAAVLVVEVASPSTREIDRALKAAAYAEAGIPGYWRIELDPVRVIAFGLHAGAYAELGTWGAGQTVEVDQPVVVRFDPAALLP